MSPLGLDGKDKVPFRIDEIVRKMRIDACSAEDIIAFAEGRDQRTLEEIGKAKMKELFDKMIGRGEYNPYLMSFNAHRQHAAEMQQIASDVKALETYLMAHPDLAADKKKMIEEVVKEKSESLRASHDIQLRDFGLDRVRGMDFDSLNIKVPQGGVRRNPAFDIILREIRELMDNKNNPLKPDIEELQKIEEKNPDSK